MVKGGASLALFAIAVAVAVAVGVVLRRRRASPSEDPGLTGSDAEVETRGVVRTTGAATRRKALTPVQTVTKAAEKTARTDVFVQREAANELLVTADKVSMQPSASAAQVAGAAASLPLGTQLAEQASALNDEKAMDVEQTDEARPDVFTPPSEYTHLADRQMGSEVRFVHQNRAELTTTIENAMQLSADSPFDCFGRCTELTACRAFSMRSTAEVDGTAFGRAPQHLCVYYGEAVNAENLVEWAPGRDTYTRDVFVKREAPSVAENEVDVEQKDEARPDAALASAQATVAAVTESAAATRAKVDDVVAQALASTTRKPVERIAIDHSQAIRDQARASKAERAELFAELAEDDSVQSARRAEQAAEQRESTTALLARLDAKLAAPQDAQETHASSETVLVQDGDADAVTTGSTCGYEERVGEDFAVGEGLWNRAGSVEECKVACDAREDCLGFSRITGEASHCWFKRYANGRWIDANSNVVGYKKRATCSDDTTAPSAANADAASSTDSLHSMSSNAADRDTNLFATPAGYTRLTNRQQIGGMMNKNDKSTPTDSYDQSWRATTSNPLNCLKKCTETDRCHALAIRSEDVSGKRAPKYLCSYRGETPGIDETSVWEPGRGGKFRDLYVKRL
jgi:hypothetical protein